MIYLEFKDACAVIVDRQSSTTEYRSKNFSRASCRGVVADFALLSPASMCINIYHAGVGGSGTRSIFLMSHVVGAH